MAISKNAFRLLKKNYDWKNSPNDVHEEGIMCARCHGLVSKKETASKTVKMLCDDPTISKCSCTTGQRLRTFGVDVKLFKAIQLFNQKGYETWSCCQGKVTDSPFRDGPAVIFRRRYDFGGCALPNHVRVEFIKDNLVSLNSYISDDELREAYPDLIELKTKRQNEFVDAMTEMAEKLPDISNSCYELLYQSEIFAATSPAMLPFRISVERRTVDDKVAIDVYCTEFKKIGDMTYSEKQPLMMKIFADSEYYAYLLQAQVRYREFDVITRNM